MTGGSGLNIKNCTALGTMILSPQNSFGESNSQTMVRRKALRERNVNRALPVYAILLTKSQNIVCRKIAAVDALTAVSVGL